MNVAKEKVSRKCSDNFEAALVLRCCRNPYDAVKSEAKETLKRRVYSGINGLKTSRHA